MKYYLFFFLWLSGLCAKANQDSIIINVHLKSKESLRLNYLDDYLVKKDLIFINSFLIDTIITKKIYSERIIELKYNLTDLNRNQHYYWIAFLRNGDNITMYKEGLALKSVSDDYKFISDFLNINDSAFSILDSKKEKNQQVADNEQNFKLNIKIVDSLLLNNRINDSISKLWKEAAFNFYNFKKGLHNMGDDLKNLTPYLQALELRLADENSVNAQSIYAAMHYLKYQNMRKGNIKNSLMALMEELIKINTNNKYKIGIAFEALNNFPEKNAKVYLDALRLFKEKLADSNFFKQDYANRMLFINKAFDKSLVKTQTINLMNSDLKEFFDKNKGKYIII